MNFSRNSLKRAPFLLTELIVASWLLIMFGASLLSVSSISLRYYEKTWKRLEHLWEMDRIACQIAQDIDNGNIRFNATQRTLNFDQIKGKPLYQYLDKWQPKIIHAGNGAPGEGQYGISYHIPHSTEQNNCGLFIFDFSFPDQSSSHQYCFIAES